MSASDTGTSGPGGDAAPGGTSRRVRALCIAAALLLWLWSALGHATGTDIAHAYFVWAEEPGALCAEGGAAGARAADLLLTGVFVLFGAGLVAFAARGIRRLPAEERRERVLAWALWAAFVHLLWKCYLMFSSEFVHFGQYALVAGLLYAGLGRGGRTVVAFLIATFLGVLDEGWQHWGLELSIVGNRWHGYEWSDTILNAAGACGGVMLLATPARPAEEPARLLSRTVAVAAAVTLPLLLLGRVALAKLFGSYTYFPAWNQYDIGKAAHWMTPIDGIPLLLASVLFLGRLAAGAQALATRGVALALVLLATLSVDRPSYEVGRPVHEDVPTAVAHRVEPGRIEIDGVPDEPEWAAAERIGPFIRNVPESPAHPPPDDARVPLAPTYARILWDERALYVAFEMQDRDVWARDAARDDPHLPGDEVVELFVDPDGDEVTYYEFEVNPAGVLYDLFNWIPETPSDMNPWAQFHGLADWDARGIEWAAAVQGTLDRVRDFAPSSPPDEDRGWSVEIAIPWSVFRTTTTPEVRSRLRFPPAPGDRWRAGLFRMERPRVRARDGALLSRDDADHLAQYQAWSPTNRDSFHRPERFGVVLFR